MRNRLKSTGGQALILVVLAMPMFFSLVGLVIDGSTVMVHRRSMQNAADGAALAAAQDLATIGLIPSGAPCSGWAGEKSARQVLVDRIQDYSTKNGGPSTLDGGSCSFDPARCNAPSDTNCYTWPYNGNAGLIEVRLKDPPFNGFFTGVINALVPGNPVPQFGPKARAVASTSPVTTTSTTPGTTVNGNTIPPTTQTGLVHTTTDPDTILGGNGVGFAMSRTCSDAITYSGAGSGGTPLGSFATNGGLTFSGSTPKKVTSLYYDKPRCSSNPPSPPSGTSSCTATAWGDASDSDNACAKNPVDLNASQTLPINWPLALPTLPTAVAFSSWNPTNDYPSKCIDLGGTNVTFTPSATWSPPSGGGSTKNASGPPGIYCLTGSSKALSLQGDFTAVGGGKGYTFFALNGSIHVSSNSPTMAFYWPSACGSRPTTRSASYTCFGRTITGYDALTLLYATSTYNDNGNCSKNAICLDGNGGNLTGDIFAPNPTNIFPPTPTTSQLGAGVFIAGGSLSAGSGFIETWEIAIQGNTGSYVGNGPGIVIPGAQHTTTDADTTVAGTTLYGTTNTGTAQTFTTGTTIGLGE